MQVMVVQKKKTNTVCIPKKIWKINVRKDRSIEAFNNIINACDVRNETEDEKFTSSADIFKWKKMVRRACDKILFVSVIIFCWQWFWKLIFELFFIRSFALIWYVIFLVVINSSHTSGIRVHKTANEKKNENISCVRRRWWWWIDCWTIANIRLLCCEWIKRECEQKKKEKIRRFYDQYSLVQYSLPSFPVVDFL